VAWPTLKTVLGQRVAPRLLDHYLARNGYDGQQTDEPKPDRPSNLWESVPGDFAAHGRFDDRAIPHSAQFWASRNRRWLALAGAALITTAGVLALRE
jgi:hypothetical protein